MVHESDLEILRLQRSSVLCLPAEKEGASQQPDTGSGYTHTLGGRLFAEQALTLQLL